MAAVRAPKVGAALLADVGDLLALIDVHAGAVLQLEALLTDAPVGPDGVLALGVNAADVNSCSTASAEFLTLVNVLTLPGTARFLEAGLALASGIRIWNY